MSLHQHLTQFYQVSEKYNIRIIDYKWKNFNQVFWKKRRKIWFANLRWKEYVQKNQLNYNKWFSGIEFDSMVWIKWQRRCYRWRFENIEHITTHARFPTENHLLRCSVFYINSLQLCCYHWICRTRLFTLHTNTYIHIERKREKKITYTNNMNACNFMYKTKNQLFCRRSSCVWECMYLICIFIY